MWKWKSLIHNVLHFLGMYPMHITRYYCILYQANLSIDSHLLTLHVLFITSFCGTEQALSTDQIRLGNKLLVYLSCCLAGRAYPFGDIPADQVSTVKYQVFSCLTSIHSKNATETESSYPYLR